MKTSHGILALSAAALLAIATAAPSLSAEIAPPTSSAESSPNTDPTGKLLLGIDIQFAGNTPSAVQNFVAGLSADQGRALEANCGQVLTDGSAVGNLGVLQFCHNLQAG